MELMDGPILSGTVSATSATVTEPGIYITAPAKAGQRVYIISASFSSDSNGTGAGFKPQDGTTYNIVCTTTATSTTVTSAALFGAVGSGPVFIGQKVSGTGIPAGTAVSTKASDSSITISKSATATGTPTLSFQGETRFIVKAEPAAAGFAVDAFTPAIPIPVSDVGQPALFFIDTTTTGRLSVNYGYGP